ncbi:type II toxin-antitoxin system VapC family toxin [Streptosporangium sp. NPDC000239]|uniref:Ribonuclease VapC n=1 Tax=Streptosporangium jomthongense TaxID=1193683 RepID=A0ABV8EW89_9ACTN
MRYVFVDTDVFSYLWQGINTDQYRPHLEGAVPALSFASVGELYYGAAKKNWGPKKVQALEEAVRRYLVAPYHEDLARLWGTLRAQAVAQGHALGAAHQVNDLWVCATAMYHDAPLLTGNRRHFTDFPGLSLLV